MSHRLSTRVFAASAVFMAVAILGAASPVAAADPTTVALSGANGAIGPEGLPQLTPAQQAIVKQKLALAHQEELHPGTVRNISHPAGMQVLSAASPADQYAAFLVTWPRQQTKPYYCGPTAVQVVGDYAWNMGPNTVHNTQQNISTWWTKTDVTGQTYLGDEVHGLNMNVGAKMPAGFIYAYARPNTGSAWHSLLRTDVVGYYMPQVTSVSPKQTGASYWLSSWANTNRPVPAGDYGHYIVYTGYVGIWDGTSNPHVYFDDGSYGWGGDTGEFSDPATHLYYMQWLTNKNHPAGGYVIW